MQLFLKIGKVLAVALCCVLMLFMTAEIAHGHSASVSAAAHCPLCIAAHVPLHTAIVLTAGIMLADFGCVADSEVALEFSLRRKIYRIRPPPASFQQ